MTRSGSVTGDRDGRGNLRDDMIDRFADYLARVVAHYRDKAGLTFQALAPLNEPLGNWWKFGGKQEGCVIPPGQQSKLIAATREALDAHGLPTVVTGPEDNRTSQALKSLAAYDQAAWRALAHVNTHTYHAENRGALRQLAEQHDKDIWVSEYGDGDPSGARLAATDPRRPARPARRRLGLLAGDRRPRLGTDRPRAFRHRDRPPTAGGNPALPAEPEVPRDAAVHLPPAARLPDRLQQPAGQRGRDRPGVAAAWRGRLECGGLRAELRVGVARRLVAGQDPGGDPGADRRAVERICRRSFVRGRSRNSRCRGNRC